jgi:RNA polymerase sigma factor (sigma-70 family)
LRAWGGDGRLRFSLFGEKVALDENGGERRRPMVAASTLSERGLHHRLLARDVAVVAEIYDQFGPTVYGVALRVTSDRHAAQDVTQETLLDLWRRPERFDPDRGGLRPWLATIAHNRSVDWIRREHTARGRDLRHGRIMFEQVPDIGADVQAVMAAARVQHALAALPEAERTAIRLAYFGGKSYRQVAVDLDVPEGTIKSRIRSGLHHLSNTMYGELAPSA